MCNKTHKIIVHINTYNAENENKLEKELNILSRNISIPSL